jgi:predicted transcriptional regulator
MKPDDLDGVFLALANQTRRRILDIVKAMPGSSVNDVAKYFAMSRIAVMKHLGVLEAAQLIVSRKPGRTRELYFNAVPIQMIYDRWTSEYGAFWASQVADLKYQIESKQAPKPPKNRREPKGSPK